MPPAEYFTDIRAVVSDIGDLQRQLLSSQLDSQAREVVNRLGRSAAQLAVMLDDVIDVAEIDNGTIELEPVDFDLHAAVGETCEIAEETAPDGVRLEQWIDPGVPRWVNADEERFRRVLASVLSSTMGLASEPTVAVDVSRRPRLGGEPVLRVVVATRAGTADAEILARLADTPADAALGGSRAVRAAAVRGLVELMGGEIGVEGDNEGRLTFWFELELAPPLTPEPADQAGASGRRRRHRRPLVLVVDDSAINQVVAVRTLERCGCRADVTSDAAGALEALAATRYEAVLIECQSSTRDASRIIAELRRKDRLSGQHTAVIAMSVSATSGEQKRWLELGMDDYVAKPLRRKTLAEVIGRLVPAAGESSS